MSADSFAELAGSYAPPHSHEAEEAVLGAVLLSPPVLRVLHDDVALRAADFYRERHRLIFEAMIALDDRGAQADLLAVAGELRDRGKLEAVGGETAVDALAAAVPGAGNARHYAETVRDQALVRRLLTATYDIQASVQQRAASPRELAARAEEQIRAVGGDAATLERDHVDPQRLAEAMLDLQQEPMKPSLPSPWPTLTRRGLRMRPGHTMVLAGWTSEGKSWAGLELADHIGSAGHHSVIWTNEMDEEEIVGRQVQRRTGVPDEKFLEGAARTEPDVARAVMDTLSNLSFGTQECHGWPADEVARHIRHVAPALAVVDHFHQFPGVAEQRVAEEAVIALTSAARQAGTFLVIVAQLNSARDSSARRPAPTLRDLRGTGALQTLPNTVLFFSRQQERADEDDEDGEARWVAMPEGMLHVAKQRGGKRDLFQPVVLGEVRPTVREMAHIGPAF